MQSCRVVIIFHTKHRRRRRCDRYCLVCVTVFSSVFLLRSGGGGGGGTKILAWLSVCARCGGCAHFSFCFLAVSVFLEFPGQFFALQKILFFLLLILNWFNVFFCVFLESMRNACWSCLCEFSLCLSALLFSSFLAFWTFVLWFCAGALLLIRFWANCRHAFFPSNKKASYKFSIHIDFGFIHIFLERSPSLHWIYVSRDSHINILCYAQARATHTYT